MRSLAPKLLTAAIIVDAVLEYRFAVRAVAAGPIDGSAAEKAFKVVRVPRHR